MKITVNEYQIEYSPLRKYILLTVYILIALAMFLVLYKLLFPENYILSLIKMLILERHSIIEKGVMVLCIAVFPVFTYYLYNYVKLIIIISQINRDNCHVVCGTGFISYSIPELYRGWFAKFKRDCITDLSENIDDIDVEELWVESMMIPARKIYLTLRSGNKIGIELLFFKGDLSDLKINIFYSVFPDKKAAAIESGQLQEKIGYRHGESILDEEGKFVIPD